MTLSQGDKAGIVDLLHALAAAIDQRDWALFESCYTPDAVLTHGSEVFSGIQAIEEAAKPLISGLDITRHQFTNWRIDEHDGTVRCVSYLAASHVLKADGRPRVYTVFARCHDELTRHEPQSWRLHRRILEPLWSEGDPDVFRDALKKGEAGHR